MKQFELSETKWSFLKELEKGPLSPKELAELTNTSIANASQQLRLLEAQGFLKKLKQKGNNIRQERDARILYSIAKQKVWVTKISKDYVDEKELKSPDNFLINLLLLDIKESKHILKFFLNNEEIQQKMSCLFYLQTWNDEIHFLVVTDKLDFFRSENHSFNVTHNNKTLTIKFWSHSVNELKEGLKNNEVYYVDIAKKITIIQCEDEEIKNLFREWKK